MDNREHVSSDTQWHKLLDALAAHKGRGSSDLKGVKLAKRYDRVATSPRRQQLLHGTHE